ncbi:YceH family protein [Bryobacter aggregatus]|uniref:YceH family protein n=1 Tax=Bryobacter aggregatus TaxID=360054 RepID=UPI0004E19987|nr:YceH family protein [Bryobacter aggregatus]
MSFQLNPVEQRVLGALIEKEMATPEYYPLSLNALVNACNQKNNREPVMQLAEADVLNAIEVMRHQNLAFEHSGREHRVPKYSEGIGQKLNLGNKDLAILCVLLCRGPQTPGELRGHTNSLYAFEDLDAVLSALSRLAHREEPLVKELPRAPGTKEARWAHLLGDVIPEVAEAPAAPRSAPSNSRIDELEERVRALEAFAEQLKSQLGL